MGNKNLIKMLIATGTDRGGERQGEVGLDEVRRQCCVRSAPAGMQHNCAGSHDR